MKPETLQARSSTLVPIASYRDNGRVRLTTTVLGVVVAGMSLVGATATVEAPAHVAGCSWRQVRADPDSKTSELAAVAPDRSLWIFGTTRVRNSGARVASIERWDGRRWKNFPLPRGLWRDVGNVSALGFSPAGDGWASANRTILRWDGQRWIRGYSAQDAHWSHAIHALGRKNAWWSLGAEMRHWNGRRWRLVKTPAANLASAEIKAITALSARDVWAVGFYRDRSGMRTFSMHWDGRVWSIVSTPNLPNDPGARPEDRGEFFLTVKALRDGTVLASRGGGMDDDVGLLRWAGTRWAGETPAPVTGYFIDGTSRSDVWLAGGHGNGPSLFHWNGVSWRGDPASARNAGLTINDLAITGRNDGWAIGRKTIGHTVLFRLRC